MSYHFYYQDPYLRLPHRGGLIGWGVVLIVAGSLLLLLVCLATIALMVMRDTSVSTGWAALVVSIVIETAAGSLAMWLGIATLWGRRRVAPVISAGCILVIAGGCAGLANYCLILPAMLFNGGVAGLPNRTFVLAGLAFTAAVMLVLTVILPAFMLRFFTRPSVRATLAELDPRPRWTETMPLTVLVWGLGGIAAGVSEAMSGAGGSLPAFAGVLDGPVAFLFGLVIGVGMIVGGALSLRRSVTGCVVQMVAIFIVAASMTTFSIAGDWDAYRKELTATLPAAQRQMAARMMPDRSTIPAAILYVGALMFGLTVPSKLRQVRDAGASPLAV
jgi:hypothetical protein